MTFKCPVIGVDYRLKAAQNLAFRRYGCSMIQAFNAAVAGLRVSAVRLGVAAENIVNVHSSGTLSPYDGYVPKRVEQTTSAHNTPVANVVPVSNPSYPVYQPGDSRADADGLVGYPTVDLGANIVDLIIAQRSYEANLVTIRTASEMMKALLDRTA